MLRTMFIANVPWVTTDEDLQKEFEGRAVVVKAARVAMDRETGRSRGFGFVECEVATDDEFVELIARLQGMQIGGRDLIINEAKPKPQAPPR